MGVVTAIRTLIAAALAGAILNAQGSPPSIEGMWNSATATPLERPVQLKDKPFFTPAEAAEWERQAAARNQEPSAEQLAKSKGTGTYNTFFREWGTTVVKTRRTSIITEPPDGRSSVPIMRRMRRPRGST